MSAPRPVLSAVEGLGANGLELVANKANIRRNTNKTANAGLFPG